MVGLPSRHKSLVLLAGVIILQILLLAVQIKRESQGRLIRVWTVGVISPFERASSSSYSWVRDLWRHYFALRGTTRDNEQLRRDLDALKLRNAQLEGKAAEADRLANLLHFKELHEEIPMIFARVIATSAGTASLTIQLDRGEQDKIRKNMGVITPDGVVGKVIETYPNASQVLLLTDKDSGVGAMIAESRDQGHVEGPVGGLGEPLLSMKYVPSDDVVNVGEHVITSGMDRIFPRDLPVGTVVEVKPGATFKQIRVKPAASLERLEEVIVLLTQQSLNLKKDVAPALVKPQTSDFATPPVVKR
jgi:rod shape-determining protein MreC